MDAVADQLCVYVRAVADSADNAWLSVCESRHGVVQMYGMVGACVKGCLGGGVVCVCVR